MEIVNLAIYRYAILYITVFCLAGGRFGRRRGIIVFVGTY